MSVAQSGGEMIDDTPERRALCERAKHFGIEVFRKKGNTCYAIGQAAAYIIESILLDEKRTVPLSVLVDGYLGVTDVCLSLPVVVGKRGVERFLHPNLNAAEAEQFREAIRRNLAEAELLTERRGTPPLLLLDDVLSELDSGRRRALVEALPPGGQTVVTATSPAALSEGAEPAAHVEVVPGEARLA